MNHIGKVVSLEVVRKSEFGYFLTDGTEEDEDVLLHNK